MNKKTLCLIVLMAVTAHVYGQHADRNQQQVQQIQIQAQDNFGRLIQGLLFGYGTRGVFSIGEQVLIPMAVVSAIDISIAGNDRLYLVLINSQASELAPFYVVSNHNLSLMNIPGAPNTVFEELVLKFVGYREYLSNRVPRNTYVFRVVN